MEEIIFRERLIRATQETLQFTRNDVVDELPDNCIYILFPNKHGEAQKLVGDAEVYPEDLLLPG